VVARFNGHIGVAPWLRPRPAEMVPFLTGTDTLGGSHTLPASTSCEIACARASLGPSGYRDEARDLAREHRDQRRAIGLVLDQLGRRLRLAT